MAGQNAEAYFGTAGWAYEDWNGIVYPRERPARFDPLEYLSRYFDCIEVNSSFYRMPGARACAAWARRISGNARFRFSVKLYRGFTHEREGPLPGPAESFRRGIEPLHDSGLLGCVLAQFPWSFKNTPEGMGYLRSLVGLFNDLPMVVEVRHESWNVPSFYEFLSDHGVGFCNIDQPLFRGSLQPSARSIAALGYFRLHGQNHENWFREDAGRDARYDYCYSEEELDGWASRIEAVSRRPLSAVYIIMNNHFKGQAACNALQLKSRFVGARVRVPPPLVAAFPQLQKIQMPDDMQGELFNG